MEQFGIEHIISFHKDYDPEILAQFFASVHFHPNEERTMTWMTNGRQLTATWKEFMTLLGVPDEGLTTPQGVRPHANPESANKNKLMPYLVQKSLQKKETVCGCLTPSLRSCTRSSGCSFTFCIAAIA